MVKKQKKKIPDSTIPELALAAIFVFLVSFCTVLAVAEYLVKNNVRDQPIRSSEKSENNADVSILEDANNEKCGVARKEDLTPEIISRIVSEVSGVKKFQDIKIEDLNNDNRIEIIISDADYDKKNYNAYIVSNIDQSGNYKKIAQLELPDFSGGWIIDRMHDINNDGTKEIILISEFISSTSDSGGNIVLGADFKGLKINQIKARGLNGKIIDIFNFLGGGEKDICIYEGWAFGNDVDYNGKKEIVTLRASTGQGTSDCSDNPKIENMGLCKNCELEAYEWNGSGFLYSKYISKLSKDLFDIQYFQNSGCERCEWK